MSLSQSELDALAALLAESLSARAGEVLTPDVIDERARNAAQLVSVAYRMRPVGQGCVSDSGEHCSCWPVLECCVCVDEEDP
jgi:hypothetical protein